MWIWHKHPADTTLIQAADHELPPARHRALDRHLGRCESCRTRLDAFERTARAARRICRDLAPDDAVRTRELRDRLQRRMTELGAEWERSSLFRFRRAANAVPAVVRVGVSVGLLALVMRLAQPLVSTGALPYASPPASLPISQFTPGATANVSVAGLCSGTPARPRVVSIAARQEVLRQYRMEHVAPSEYELDYLITPELGGVAEARNLWPQRYESGVWNARVKDDLERLLPRLVCQRAVDLGVAQREIADNWIDAYKKYFKTERPVPRQAQVVDDDDELVFEDTTNPPPAHLASLSFVRPPDALVAKLTTTAGIVTARSRRIAW